MLALAISRTPIRTVSISSSSAEASASAHREQHPRSHGVHGDTATDVSERQAAVAWNCPTVCILVLPKPKV